MTERRFDGRVAVITGSGRGLGFEYARLLASRGARIVINDNGSSLDGSGGDTSVAQQAADRIKAEGGEAIACTDSVATTEGGKAIVQAALDTWGRIDVLIHNAGNTRFDDFATITPEAFRSLIDVHLLGAFNVTQPAFGHMCKAGYGRVVLTGSIGGLYTMPQTAGYAVSKAGTMGLNNVIAIEGAAHGVKSNIILPGAVTRMAEGLDTSQYPPMGPELVAPVVGYLAHEDCAVSAEMFVAMSGRVARAFVSETPGIYRPEWSIEDVAENLAAIRDPSELWALHPAENGFVEHLTRSFAMVRGEG
ncbi:MAG: SDR family NAD(P)-dependent oxidoreductase [Sphingomonadales bacterium]|nr:SDR family NAD(P)-dependent oxidoreductase [Sphingomonadales bacterium]